MDAPFDPGTEAQIREWRTYLLRRRTIDDTDVEELEDHLRIQISELGAAGLSSEESFLVAIRRIGALNDLSREFARERSSQLWKQLLGGPRPLGDSVRERSWLAYREVAITLAIAIGAALAFKLPALLGIDPWETGRDSADAFEPDFTFYLHNTWLLTLPFVVGFFAWRRGLSLRTVAVLAVPFAGAAILMNAYPFDRPVDAERLADTEVLAGIHLFIVLWLVAGIAYLGGGWREDAPRMDFVRFTGEWVIYYVLIALGGGVLSATTIGVFAAIDVNVERFVVAWVLPCGAVGAVIVVAWLVEAKQSVIENMAPVLTSVFTPLFAIMLMGVVVGMAMTGNVVDPERDVLIVLDLLLVVVVGLVLYSISARDNDASPTLMDGIQLVLVASALVIDVVALGAILGRISEFGFTPNRVAGLGLNVVLLVNLAWSAWLLTGFIRGRRPFRALERWQTRYVPVYALWAAVVVVVFPPLFGFD